MGSLARPAAAAAGSVGVVVVAVDALQCFRTRKNISNRACREIRDRIIRGLTTGTYCYHL
jgi:hypothetical protein